MSKKKQQIMIIVIFLIGCAILLYPFYSNAINSVYDAVMMRKFEHELERSATLRHEALQKESERRAQEGFNPGSDPFTDEQSSQPTKINHEEALIGKVIIPKINVEMPLYDRTTPELLEYGATVLEGTSMPVGGLGTHTVVTGHRGLPNRELFTNLPKLDVGDRFLFTVLGETIAYEVIEKSVVEPHETDGIKLMPDQDLATLITCTPYMVNSHRLLVTGKRIDYTPEIKSESEAATRNHWKKQNLILAGVGVLFLGGIVVIVKKISEDKKEKDA